MATAFTKFRPKNSKRIDAIQLTPDNAIAIAMEIGARWDPSMNTLYVATLMGPNLVQEGAYIIRDPMTNVITTMSPAEFLELYEPVAV